jgi:hypothetical protein
MGFGQRIRVLSWQAIVLFAFRLQVSHQTQEPPSKLLPARPGVPRSASWRTDASTVRGKK